MTSARKNLSSLSIDLNNHGEQRGSQAGLLIFPHIFPVFPVVEKTGS